MCKYSADKELNKYVRELITDGWVYARKKKHGRLKSPCNKWVTTVPGSPSDVRAFRNFKQDIARFTKRKFSKHLKND